MAKVITFSRRFPQYHPKAGQLTYFTEKFWESHYTDFDYKAYMVECNLANPKITRGPKHHTIRAGKRWKVGDKFSPRVWSATPYNSKQIAIAPDVEVKKVWDFVMYSNDKHVHIEINGKEWLTSNGSDFYMLMQNDGLDPDEFKDWFTKSPEFKKKKRFDGQIICWNENVNY